METITRATPDTAASAATPRFDLYEGIHKALRLFMGDTLARVGALDLADAAEVEATLGQLEALLHTLASHVKHENDFLHAAIEARRPGGASVTAEAHVEHLESIAQLRADAARLAAAPVAARRAPARRLYQHLALFVAENLQHMQVEETANNAALWALYTDAELVEIHDRLVAAVEPAAMAEYARWFAPALPAADLAGMLADMRAKMPPEAFIGVTGLMRSRVDAARWAKVEAALAA